MISRIIKVEVSVKLKVNLQVALISKISHRLLANEKTDSEYSV